MERLTKERCFELFHNSGGDLELWHIEQKHEIQVHSLKINGITWKCDKTGIHHFQDFCELSEYEPKTLYDVLFEKVSNLPINKGYEHEINDLFAIIESNKENLSQVYEQ